MSYYFYEEIHELKRDKKWRWARGVQLSIYPTHVIITCGLYIFTPSMKVKSVFLESFFHKILTLKFIYSEKAKIFCKIFTLLFSHIVPVKSKVKIWQNFAAISEYINFMYNWYSRVVYDQEQVMMARIP